MRPLCLAIAACLVLLQSPSARGATVYVADIGGRVGAWDSATNSGTFVGNLSSQFTVGQVLGIAYDPVSNRILLLDRYASTPTVYSMDPSTGIASALFLPGFLFQGGAVLGGVLYGINENTQTAAAFALPGGASIPMSGGTLPGHSHALGVDPSSGRLYSSNGSFIYEVDPGTGTALGNVVPATFVEDLDVFGGDFLGTICGGEVKLINGVSGATTTYLTSSQLVSMGVTDSCVSGIAVLSCNNDGVVDSFEQCDDGNPNNGDGCSSQCRVEPCWSCSGAPSSCAPQTAGTACLDDGNECTTDACDGAGTCAHPGAPIGTPCIDDGNVCTSDACDGAGACAHPGDVPIGTPCPDDGNVCTSDSCDGAGACAHPGDVPLGTPCPDDGNVCTNDQCDGAGACTHPGDVPAGSPCPDDGSLCTADACDGAGTCAHPDAVDCDGLNQCYPPGSFACDPQTGTCQACPAGYTTGGGGCQKSYAIDASLLDNLGSTCGGPGERYNGCSGAFGFHWTDAGDAGVGAVTGVDLQIEAGISCSGTNRSVLLNGNPVGSYAPAGACTCGSPQAPRLLAGIDVSSYVKGGANAVLTDDPGNCDGLSDDGSGAFAVVTVTYAALPLVPLPDGTACDDATFCNGADSCAAGACTTHGGDPCPGPDGDVNCAESCDEAADACTAADAGGTLCRAATGDCDVAETCDGATAACPADAKQTDGTGCDDGSVCTQSDSCQGGICTGADPIDCNDGDACTADSCDAMGGCVNDDAPATGCLAPGKSIVLIKSNASDHGKDKLLWKWIKGAAVDQTDLADPTGTTDYALCVYAGTASTLIANAALPSGSGWSAIGDKGYKFKGTSPDGLSLALLKGGAAGKSKALAKGKGATLPDPTLPVVYPLTVQLRKDGSPVCLESVFTSADEKKNTATQFKAKQ